MRSQIQATVTYDNIFEGTQFWSDRLWGNKSDATIDNEVLTTHSGFPVTKYFTVSAQTTIHVYVEVMRDNVVVADTSPSFQLLVSNGTNVITENSFGVRLLASTWTADGLAYGYTIPSGYNRIAVRLIGGEGMHYRRLYVTTNEGYIWKPSPSDTPAEIQEVYSRITQTAEQIRSEASKTYETKEDAKNTKTTLESSITQTAEQISTKVSKNEVISEINQTAEKVKIKADKIELDGAVVANATLTAPTINGAIISGGAASFGGNKTVINEDGMWVLGLGGVENPDFRVDQTGFVHLGSRVKMSSAGIWWTDNTGSEHFKAWSSFFGF